MFLFSTKKVKANIAFTFFAFKSNPVDYQTLFFGAIL